MPSCQGQLTFLTFFPRPHTTAQGGAVKYAEFEPYFLLATWPVTYVTVGVMLWPDLEFGHSQGPPWPVCSVCQRPKTRRDKVWFTVKLTLKAVW